MKIKNTMRQHFTWLLSKRKKEKERKGGVGKDIKNWNSCALLMGM